MTKRMQVLIEDDEYREIKEAAARQRMTVAEWVRQALRRARTERANGIDARLQAIASAARHQYPTGDIDDMLQEIEQGRSTP